MKARNPYVIIGSRLRELRKQKKLGQNAIGELVGLSRSSVVNIENGLQSLTIDNLYAFCLVYDCEPQDILISLEEYKSTKSKNTLVDILMKEYPEKAKSILLILNS